MTETLQTEKLAQTSLKIKNPSRLKSEADTCIYDDLTGTESLPQKNVYLKSRPGEYHFFTNQSYLSLWQPVTDLQTLMYLAITGSCLDTQPMELNI